jgi:hypothetical protein
VIYNNVYVTRTAAYRSNGAIIPGTQRISTEQPQKYWQGANIDVKLYKDFALYDEVINIDSAVYVGRIPKHFGHFLLEGLPRMCDLINLKLPFVGYITEGCLPEGIKSMKVEEIYKMISLISSEKFYEIAENEIYFCNTLFVPTLPVVLSHTVQDPVKMSTLINHIVVRCRDLHSDVLDIEHLHLNRLEEKISERSNDPNDPLTLQIAKVSRAKSLYGKAGSNTHLSMFAGKFTKLNWQNRNDPDQTDRNQLICDLIKTYNEF